MGYAQLTFTGLSKYLEIVKPQNKALNDLVEILLTKTRV
jgi:hypothetical protein